ncbi:MAG TPA: TraB/GumN family protein [Sphingomicrobium sp.]
MRTMTLLGRLLAPVAALLALASPSTAAAPAGRPALWAVSDSDTTVYLFGTIHLLPANYQWRTPRFNQAVSSSQQLVVETLVDLQKPDGIQAAKLNLGFSRGLPPIAERVPPEKRALLRSVIAKSGIPEKYYDQMETWLAAFELLGVRFREIGLAGEAGPEQTLQREFTAARKPIGELETNAEQLGYFDKLPEAAQRILLEGAIEEPKNMNNDFAKMLASWSRGDVKAISVSFNRDLSVSPALKEALLDRRNANWSRWVGQRMAIPGSVMLAVGAGHLAGPESLVAMLKREGYKVRRVQ